MRNVWENAAKHQLVYFQAWTKTYPWLYQTLSQYQSNAIFHILYWGLRYMVRHLKKDLLISYDIQEF